MEIDFAPFHEMGYQHLPGQLDPGAVALLRTEADRILTLAEGAAAEPAEGPCLHNILSAQPGGAEVDGRRSLHVEHVFRFSPRFQDLIHDPRLAGPAAALCGPDLRLLDDQLYWKPAGVGGPTYIHRDSDFFGPLQVITVWVPLGDVDEQSGCLWAVPGSHRLERPLPGLRKRTSAPEGAAPDRRPFDYFYQVDWPAAGFRPIPMKAGDILLIHRHTLHCSLDVEGRHERLAYLVEYCAAGDLERHRADCPGLFEYHDRWRYMAPIRRAGAV